VSKPEWIRGHYFNALSILVGVGKVCFALPLVLRLDDGIKSKPTQTAEVKGKKKVKTSLVTKMADLCVTYAEAGSYVILDAYFACEPVLKVFRQNALASNHKSALLHSRPAILNLRCSKGFSPYSVPIRRK
jgi:hypothetical protein